MVQFHRCRAFQQLRFQIISDKKGIISRVEVNFKTAVKMSLVIMVMLLLASNLFTITMMNRFKTQQLLSWLQWAALLLVGIRSKRCWWDSSMSNWHLKTQSHQKSKNNNNGHGLERTTSAVPTSTKTFHLMSLRPLKQKASATPSTDSLRTDTMIHKLTMKTILVITVWRIFWSASAILILKRMIWILILIFA